MNPARLNMFLGKRGEIVGTKTYSNSRYTLTMRTDGAIEVKHGDWLSKYSSAMYNDFSHIHEFARMDKDGKVKKILAVNHIFAGETIYHIPTYNDFHPMRLDPIEVMASPLSDDQEEQLIVDTVNDDYDLQGEKLELLVGFAHIATGIEKGVDITEIVGEGAAWIVEGTATAAAFGTVGAFATVIASLLEPISIGIEVLNANDTDKKLAGMQAIGYAITAWAFDDPIPGFPASLRKNFMAFPGIAGLQRVEPAWREASEAVVRNLEAMVRKSGRSKLSLQITWQAVGQQNRKVLVRRLMDARADDLNDVERISFQALDPDGYPN